jgi:Tfp pilus assembly protein PilZ
VPYDGAEYILRDPRYVIAEGQQTFVELRRDDDPAAPPISSLLVDMSRKGMQILADVSLEIGEKITVFLREPSAELEVQLSGKVQWQRGTDDQQFVIGCQFDEDVNWETLGELFLSGILDQKTAV